MEISGNSQLQSNAFSAGRHLGNGFGSGLAGIHRHTHHHPTASGGRLTPVEQGNALRERDSGAGKTLGETLGERISSAVQGAVKAIKEALHSPIRTSSTVTHRPDGTKVTTVYIDVKANFRVDGGTLPKGTTAASEARTIERAIENDFSKTYTADDGSVTRYVTRVDMTVGGPATLTREQFILVQSGDSRLGGGSGTLGIAPGFENGRTAYISDTAGARTAPHEFGHLAGLRHTAQVDQGCTTAPGIDIENLMSQTGCSATSHQIERSQLQQIYNNPVFR